MFIPNLKTENFCQSVESAKIFLGFDLKNFGEIWQKLTSMIYRFSETDLKK